MVPASRVPFGTAARSLRQTRSRITATSVMPSAARLGTSTAAPEAKASIATQSNGLSTKRGTIRSSFPDLIQRIPNRLRSSGCLKPFDASSPKGTEAENATTGAGRQVGTQASTDLKGHLHQEEQPTALAAYLHAYGKLLSRTTVAA